MFCAELMPLNCGYGLSNCERATVEDARLVLGSSG